MLLRLEACSDCPLFCVGHGAVVPSRSVALSVGACVAALGGVVVIMRRGSRAPAAPSWPGHSARSPRSRALPALPACSAWEKKARCLGSLPWHIARRLLGALRSAASEYASGGQSQRAHACGPIRFQVAGRLRGSFPSFDFFFSCRHPDRRRPAWSPWPSPCELALRRCQSAQS